MSDARNKILDDVSQLVSGLGVAAQGVREELAQTLRGMLDTMLADGALVTREEFEVVREMAEKARGKPAFAGRNRCAETARLEVLPEIFVLPPIS